MTPEGQYAFGTAGDEGGGQVTIAENVLVSIAHREAMATDGAVPALEPMTQGMLRRRQPYHVRVEIVQDQVVLEMTIGVQGGKRIPDVADRVRQAIVQAVHEKTGHGVRAVNLRVDHVEYGPAESASQ